MTLNLRGHLTDFSQPQVMGILNVTPDSFYAASRTLEAKAICARAEQILAEGGSIIDVGACSTRPGGEAVTADDEMRRLDTALTIIRKDFPDAVVSVDTFRADVARRCVQDFAVDIVNDVSSGAVDSRMFETVADLHVPYVLTHSGGMADAAVPDATSEEAYLPAVARFFAERLQTLYEMGVSDVILDPGFGFGKTLEQNYQLLHALDKFITLFPDNPFLVGVSRKSMIYRLLGTTPEESLNGTTALHSLALQAGAHILRVHDVREAVETVKIVGQLQNSKS